MRKHAKNRRDWEESETCVSAVILELQFGSGSPTLLSDVGSYIIERYFITDNAKVG
jgi:hypothetical protein